MDKFEAYSTGGYLVRGSMSQNKMKHGESLQVRSLFALWLA